MSYVKIIEPLQKGKTSIIKNLKGSIPKEKYFIIEIDISGTLTKEDNCYIKFSNKLEEILKPKLKRKCVKYKRVNMTPLLTPKGIRLDDI